MFGIRKKVKIWEQEKQKIRKKLLLTQSLDPDLH
jgi:hypothetical protein